MKPFQLSVSVVTIASLALISAGTLSACNSKNNETASITLPGTKYSTESTVKIDKQAIQEDVGDTIDAIQYQFEKGMTDIDAQMHRLEESASEAGAEARADLEASLRAFDKEKAEIDVRFEQVNRDSNQSFKEEWKELKNDMDNLWEDVKAKADSYDNAEVKANVTVKTQDKT